jgi:hypothetical protein
MHFGDGRLPDAVVIALGNGTINYSHHATMAVFGELQFQKR